MPLMKLTEEFTPADLAPRPRPASERRRHRRHELATTGVDVEHAGETGDSGGLIGPIVDLSAGGVRVRTNDAGIVPGQTLDVRLTLPPHAGIQPFVKLAGGDEDAEPACEWTGRLEVLRRVDAGGRADRSGRPAAGHDRGRPRECWACTSASNRWRPEPASGILRAGPPEEEPSCRCSP